MRRTLLCIAVTLLTAPHADVQIAPQEGDLVLLGGVLWDGTSPHTGTSNLSCHWQNGWTKSADRILAERHEKLAAAHHRRREENLKIRQRELPLPTTWEIPSPEPTANQPVSHFV
jgi:hypothetical protein